MSDIALRTRHACPECDGGRVYLVLTRLMDPIHHPEHGTLEVAEGVEIDGADDLCHFSSEIESAPDYICFDCGWVS